MPKILLGNHYDTVAFTMLEDVVPDGFELEQLNEASHDQLLSAIPDADYLIASGRIRIDSQVINRAVNLKMIARTGVGLDSIDQEALEKSNIALCVNEGINAVSVAEHTVLLILSALRRLIEADGSVKRGLWLKHAVGVQTHELYGKKVFIAGCGNIGRRVAEILKAFGCEVFSSNNLKKGDLPPEFFDADIITLHCPLLPSTFEMIDEDAISRAKRGCILVNTARGCLIDEPALASGLKSGQIGFACLDVRAVEPNSSPSPFAGMENVILTPHIAGITKESFIEMLSGAISNIVKFDEKLTR